MLLFQEEGKTENSEKNPRSKARTSTTYNKFYRVRRWTFTRRVLFLPFCGFWHATGNCSKLRVEDSSVFRDHQKVIDINSVISAMEILFHKEVAPTPVHGDSKMQRNSPLCRSH